MPYPEALVHPMREQLTRLGVEELLDPAAVDQAFEDSEAHTTLLVINSVSGCAAANARPAVALALQSPQRPDRLYTVFAGQDLDATARVREHLRGIPPSSPFIALLKDGDPVFVVERRHIEGRSASAIAMDLVNAFGKYCGSETAAAEGPERPEVPNAPGRSNGLPPTFKSIM
jgi:putative YphP/YqiW family bacilliredoxin